MPPRTIPSKAREVPPFSGSELALELADDSPLPTRHREEVCNMAAISNGLKVAEALTVAGIDGIHYSRKSHPNHQGQMFRINNVMTTKTSQTCRVHKFTNTSLQTVLLCQLCFIVPVP